MIVPAGRINKLFGTEGGVMLSLYPAFPEDFTTDTPLRVTIDALEVPLWCERFERRGQSGATATFADFDTERRAQGRCWSPPSRSSTPASTSRGARCTWCCPKDS